VLANEHPRSVGDDVADVDGIRNYDGIHRVSCVYGRVTSEFKRAELEVDAGFHSYSVSFHLRTCHMNYAAVADISVSPMFVCAQVYFCPESPRWYMIKNRYKRAYEALSQLRPSSLQAARDLYYIHSALQVEEKLREGKQLWREMFTVPRNRRAAQSSFFVMFMQQVIPPQRYHQINTKSYSSAASMQLCTTPRLCSATPASNYPLLLQCLWGVALPIGSLRFRPCTRLIPLVEGICF